MFYSDVIMIDKFILNLIFVSNIVFYWYENWYYNDYEKYLELILRKVLYWFFERFNLYLD